jgi:hypothetical protein
MTGDSQDVSGSDGPVGVPEPPLRGGSLPLPGLKHWRLRKRLSQKELARRVGPTSHHLYKSLRRSADRSPPRKGTKRSRRPCAISFRCARTSSTVTRLLQALWFRCL